MATFQVTAGPPPRPSLCEICDQVDLRGKHHVMTGVQANPVTGDAELVIESRHFACCIARGCPDGTCVQVLREEEERLAAS